ncbi:MAG: sigma-54 dependent transcriptional regulator [Polyangia bacterium]
MSTGPKPRILVIDDETALHKVLSICLQKAGYEVTVGDSGERGIELARTVAPAAILVDRKLPGMDGIAVIRALVQLLPAVPVILITAHGSIDSAVEAMRAGACDYLVKPFTPLQVRQVIEQTLAQSARRQEVATGPRLSGRDVRINLESRSPAMRSTLALCARAAETDATVLLLGETGTGKSTLARHIHTLSARAALPFVTVHCASIAPTLIESQLFGHCRGSFTGADRPHTGFVEVAGSGTLFLDDIGELPLEVQGKLLRLLEEREYVRVGESAALRSQARIIAATHRDLKAEVRAQRFRQDLYYRLNVFSLRVPALRERREDIPVLARGLVDDLAQRYRRGSLCIPPDVERALLDHAWPGNLRELLNVLERAVILAAGSALDPELLPEELRSAAPDADPDTSETLDAAERRHLMAVLARHPTLDSAAKALGIDPSTLYRKRDRHGLP